MTAPFPTIKPLPSMQAAPKLSVYHVGLLRDLAAGKVVSWTFAPGSQKGHLRHLLTNKLICLQEVRLEGDTRVYEVAALTEYGKQVLAEMGAQ